MSQGHGYIHPTLSKYPTSGDSCSQTMQIPVLLHMFAEEMNQFYEQPPIMCDICDQQAPATRSQGAIQSPQMVNGAGAKPTLKSFGDLWFYLHGLLEIKSHGDFRESNHEVGCSGTLSRAS